MRTITCPYCMESFDSDAVHFRVTSPTEKRKVMESINMISNSKFAAENEANPDKNKIADYERALDEYRNKHLKFCINENPDPYLRKYYDELGMDIEYVNDQKKYLPYIDFTNNLLLANGSREGSCSRDASGMIVAVTDSRGVTTKARLCPHCHNELPENYGSCNTIFMSVIGITQSGKTVYLSSFLRDLEDELAKAGLTLVSASKAVDEFLANYPVEQGKPLPMGTVAAKPSEPLVFNIRTTDERNQTVVLFDIAGENCVDSRQMQIYGKFIKKSDGIIMLVDPHQFAEIGIRISDDAEQTEIDEDAMSVDSSRTTPTKVLQTIHDAFFGSSDEKIKVPVALAVGKFDQLECLAEPGNGLDTLFHDIEVPANIPPSARSAFYVNKFKMDASTKYSVLRRFIATDRSGFTLLNHIEKLYARTILFAVSALGIGTHYKIDDMYGKQKILDTQPVPFGVYNPFFWILFNCMGGANNQPVNGESKKDSGGGFLGIFRKKR